MPTEMLHRLRALADARGTTVSHLVRVAVEKTYETPPLPSAWQGALSAAVGMWADRDDMDEQWSRRVRAGGRRLAGVDTGAST